MCQTLLVTCLKTSTFCYLLPELQLFFRYWEKIPRSQKCGCNPWDRVTQQRLRGCQGKLPGGRGFEKGIVPGQESHRWRSTAFCHPLSQAWKRTVGGCDAWRICKHFGNLKGALTTLSFYHTATDSLVLKSLTSITHPSLIKSLFVRYTDQSQQHLSHTHKDTPGCPSCWP